jgi:transposase
MQGSSRYHISLSEKTRAAFQKAAKARHGPKSTVDRARTVLLADKGCTVTEIMSELGIAKTTVYDRLGKFIDSGNVEDTLADKKRSGRPQTYSDEETAYIINAACSKPCEHGLGPETWTVRLLTQHVRTHCVEDGFPRLTKISKTTICRFLHKDPIKPHKIRYFCEKRDPDHDAKQKNVTDTYREVEEYIALNEGKAPEDWSEPDCVIVCVDEKPGIQIIENVTPDLPPNDKHECLSRDHEYKRHGTASLLCAKNLMNGIISPIIRQRHRSCEFIELLTLLDDEIPHGKLIKVILDNHSAHKSKEVNGWLDAHPGRFKFIFTPVHASWLNLAECVFSSISRSCLRHFRAKSFDELQERLLKFIKEKNVNPTIYRWRYMINDTNESK